VTALADETRVAEQGARFDQRQIRMSAAERFWQ